MRMSRGGQRVRNLCIDDGGTQVLDECARGWGRAFEK
jgi:hypothetical protein